MDKKKRINLSDIFSQMGNIIDNNDTLDQPSADSIFKVSYKPYDLLELIIKSLNSSDGDYETYIRNEISERFKYVNYHSISVFLDNIVTFIKSECSEYKFNQTVTDACKSKEDVIETCDRTISIIDDMYKKMCGDS